MKVAVEAGVGKAWLAVECKGGRDAVGSGMQLGCSWQWSAELGRMQLAVERRGG